MYIGSGSGLEFTLFASVSEHVTAMTIDGLEAGTNYTVWVGATNNTSPSRRLVGDARHLAAASVFPTGALTELHFTTGVHATGVEYRWPSGSHNFVYSSNVTQHAVLATPDDTLELYFDRFDLECDYDAISVFLDDPSPSSPTRELLWRGGCHRGPFKLSVHRGTGATRVKTSTRGPWRAPFSVGRWEVSAYDVHLNSKRMRIACVPKTE